MDPVLQTILYSVIASGLISAGMAILIYLVAKKFHVEVDPRVDEVFEMLPAANCGGCGSPGCKSFAGKIVKTADTGDISGLMCPPGGAVTMEKIAKFLNLEIKVADPTIAVVRCNGTNEKAPAKAKYDGPTKCSVANSLFAGESGCPYGCLGLGDCVTACTFDAILIDKTTGLPLVSDKNCVACGACVRACPRKIIEIRPVGKKNRRVFIGCINTEKGAVAMKNCKAACIACGKCAKECPVQAITVANNVAYIDTKKCIACGKCIPVCPTKAVMATFEAPKQAPKAEEKAEVKVEQ